ncbi:hypothetical protein BH10BAC5_BH10BAC5_14900 [soil metagenome]
MSETTNKFRIKVRLRFRYSNPYESGLNFFYVLQTKNNFRYYYRTNKNKIDFAYPLSFLRMHSMPIQKD